MKAWRLTGSITVGLQKREWVLSIQINGLRSEAVRTVAAAFEKQIKRLIVTVFDLGIGLVRA